MNFVFDSPPVHRAAGHQLIHRAVQEIAVLTGRAVELLVRNVATNSAAKQIPSAVTMSTFQG